MLSAQNALHMHISACDCTTEKPNRCCMFSTRIQAEFIDLRVPMVLPMWGNQHWRIFGLSMRKFAALSAFRCARFSVLCSKSFENEPQNGLPLQVCDFVIAEYPSIENVF